MVELWKQLSITGHQLSVTFIGYMLEVTDFAPKLFPSQRKRAHQDSGQGWQAVKSSKIVCEVVRGGATCLPCCTTSTCMHPQSRRRPATAAARHGEERVGGVRESPRRSLWFCLHNFPKAEPFPSPPVCRTLFVKGKSLNTAEKPCFMIVALYFSK